MPPIMFKCHHEGHGKYSEKHLQPYLEHAGCDAFAIKANKIDTLGQPCQRHLAGAYGHAVQHNAIGAKHAEQCAHGIGADAEGACLCVIAHCGLTKPNTFHTRCEACRLLLAHQAVDIHLKGGVSIDVDKVLVLLSRVKPVGCLPCVGHAVAVCIYGHLIVGRIGKEALCIGLSVDDALALATVAPP